MNNRRSYFYLLLIASVIGIFLTIWKVFLVTEPPIHYPENPYLHYLSYEDYVFGNGTVTPGSDQINIFSPIEKRIRTVLVKEGDKVKKGQLLMQLDPEELAAKMAVDRASLAKARAEYDKLQALPRHEDVVVQEANVQQAQVAFDEAERQQNIAEELFNQKAISEGEWRDKNYQAKLEKARLDAAKAELDKVRTGASMHDLEVAQKEIEHQKALLNVDKAKLAETNIYSPLDGTVLEVNAHVGEIAFISGAKPLMALGNVDVCNVEVQIYEDELARLVPNQNAVGFFRDKNAPPISLSFVRIRPLVVAKKNVSGPANEKVDTRVLLVVYRFSNPPFCVYVGQEMDVFIPRHSEMHTSTL